MIHEGHEANEGHEEDSNPTRQDPIRPPAGPNEHQNFMIFIRFTSFMHGVSHG
jgi:hypothetical protein